MWQLVKNKVSIQIEEWIGDWIDQWIEHTTGIVGTQMSTIITTVSAWNDIDALIPP